MMNFLSSRITSVSKLIEGSLKSIIPTYNHVPVRTGMSRVLAKSFKPNRKWPCYRKKYKDGIQYYGFIYYPRSAHQVDPIWKPSELFMVRRVKCYKGNPYWEKKILKKYGLDLVSSDIAIVVNNEITNAELWKIKHLIEITPISFPDGYPSEEDLTRCRLYENGECKIDKSIGQQPASLEATDELHRQPEGPTKFQTDKLCRKRWLFPFASNTPL